MKLSDTILWKYLNEGDFETEDKKLAKKLSLNLEDICNDAANRMKDVRRSFPQYTLHDEIHLIKVVDIMGKIIPKDVLHKLNPVEIFLLILSAFFHDQGIVIDDHEYDKIKESPEYKISLKNWEIKFSNLSEIRKKLNLLDISKSDKEYLEQLKIELERGHLIEFIRKKHGKRSSDYFIKNYSKDPRLEINGINISYLVAKLCESHTQNSSDLNESNGFRYNELVYKFRINMIYLAIILRLADILDFDHDRTPKVLYKTIKFKSKISIKEWNKHLSVYGRKITSKQIQYTCWCDTPEYEKAVRDFIKWINNELSSSLYLIKKFPGEYANYYLELPPQVEQSQIGPKNHKYIYKDLEFSLSHEEIIKLFMTDKLYKHKSLCVRELLQNSLDGLNYKKILYQNNGAQWDNGYVKFLHYLNEDGYEVLRCEDNGIGMDLFIIENFLTKVGKSYYNSPEFFKEREELLNAGLKFDPNAIFGIGFLSCFMIGDQIKIITRKFYGPERQNGIPYIIEINGISGILTIRKGEKNQPTGTIVEVIRRDKEIFHFPYSDIINLINILDGYALNSNFPITAKCEIPGIENDIKIPPGIPKLMTSFEEEDLKHIITFEEEFHEINKSLEGKIRISLLIDEKNQITLDNDEAYFKKKDASILLYIKNNKHNTKKILNLDDINTKICFDGILVCGIPGRDKEPFVWATYTNRIYIGRVFFVLNVSSELKASLTPDRHAPSRPEKDKKWINLIKLAKIASGRLWEKICIKAKNNPELFWKLMVIFRGNPLYMREKEIWNNISIPFKYNNNKYKWVKISELKKLEFNKIDQNYCCFKAEDNSLLTSPLEVIEWTTIENINILFQRMVLTIGTLTIENDSPIILLENLESSNMIPIEKYIDVDYQIRYFTSYDKNLSDVISVETPTLKKNYIDYTVNRNHPLSKIVIESEFSENLTEIEKFAIHAVGCLSSKITFESLRKSKFEPTRYMKYLGKYYLFVKSELPNELLPPYRIWIKDKGFIEIIDKILKKWANSKIKID